MEPVVAPVHSEAEIETVIASLGRKPRGGLVVPSDPFMLVHRADIPPHQVCAAVGHKRSSKRTEPNCSHQKFSRS
jgi:hypothetical protein